MIWFFLVPVGLLLGVVIIIVVSPIGAGGEVRSEESEIEGAFSLYFLHPRVVTAYYSFIEQHFEIVLFSRFRFSFSEPQQPPSHEETPSSGTISASGEQQVHDLSPGSGKDSHTAESEHTEDAELSEDDREDLASTVGGIEYPGVGEDEKDREDVEEDRAKQSLWNRLRTNPVLFVLRQKRWREKVFRWIVTLISRLLHFISFDTLYIRIRFGLPDPSLTGKVYGYWEGVKYGLIPSPNASFAMNLIPSFTDECFDFHARIAFHTAVSRIVIPVGSAIVTFPYLSTFLLWRRLKRRVKNSENK
jgi:hypothetical protein